MPRKTTEDDLAGVSELMKAIPDEAASERPKKSKTKPKSKIKKYKTREKKARN